MMTVKGLTVVFDHELSLEDARRIAAAIETIRGVVRVELSETQNGDEIVRMTERSELAAELQKLARDLLLREGIR